MRERFKVFHRVYHGTVEICQRKNQHGKLISMTLFSTCWCKTFHAIENRCHAGFCEIKWLLSDEESLKGKKAEKSLNSLMKFFCSGNLYILYNFRLHNTGWQYSNAKNFWLQLLKKKYSTLCNILVWRNFIYFFLVTSWLQNSILPITILWKILKRFVHFHWGCLQKTSHTSEWGQRVSYKSFNTVVIFYLRAVHKRCP